MFSIKFLINGNIFCVLNLGGRGKQKLEMKLINGLRKLLKFKKNHGNLKKYKILKTFRNQANLGIQKKQEIQEILIILINV